MVAEREESEHILGLHARKKSEIFSRKKYPTFKMCEREIQRVSGILKPLDFAMHCSLTLFVKVGGCR